MDKQGRIGMILLMALLAGYLLYNQQQQSKFFKQKQEDSIAQAKLHPVKADTTLMAKADSNQAVAAVKADSNAVTVVQNVLENALVKITFTNKGAQPVNVELKHFKTAISKQAVQVFKANQNAFDVAYKTSAGNMLHTKDVSFVPAANGKSITYTAAGGPSITYTLPDSSYMVDMHIAGNGTVDASNAMNLNWTSTAPNNEYDHVTEMQYTTIAYNESKEGTDHNSISDDKTVEFKEGLKYLTFKQHYFNTSLIATDKDFTSARVNYKATNDTSNQTLAAINANINLAAGQDANLQMYCGPNDYELLKSYNKKLEEMIPLEYSKWLSFIRYLNKWVILPLFDMLASVFQNYGLIIMMLTIIIRLLMSPITYKSYLSSAKMKVLKPELDELKAKYADDQQAFGVKQMELFRSAGVSPLGGCLPALAQLPIFFALLSFLPNAIQLRQQPFLWAKDLSTFDSILTLPFSIPAYGNHVSLWTLLFVATSLVMALYNMNSTPTDNSNPALKYMPFIMPVIFLGVFNKMPAALTFYYVVSNIFTLILQFVIQNYVINHDKIRTQIDENKTKGPKTSKFMEKMVEMQKQNQERMKKGK
ncbi:MAG: membrane protein insertase YidC [Chitinophagaceae bacterium]|nr:membrane protein insertase YidC [Chitinophagaceae bacterium]